MTTQALERIDEAEPADEPFVCAKCCAKPSGDRLPVEIQLELHHQRAILTSVGLVIHWNRPYAGAAATASGSSPILTPELRGVGAVLELSRGLPFLVCQRGPQLRATRDAELAEDVAQMGLDGLFA